ncbi:hypothetical protein I552_4238 [Mycobacterium xenopi 3993]|nr:hypothetical protein I552_4238 [Mycobacterium xenopi 3993]
MTAGLCGWPWAWPANQAGNAARRQPDVDKAGGYRERWTIVPRLALHTTDGVRSRTRTLGAR